ncbi:tetratricopeptide repeat protein [Streptomyces sp. R08]|uniref:Tetratricopeptide repeat protein n=1 Tax=Streptomyces sp. R08 TaxID=3238624 RepID=A0AB39MCC7_9ACTN
MAGDIYNGPTASQHGDHNRQFNNFFGAGQKTPAEWPHQVGVIPSQAGCFQNRAEVARLRSAVGEGSTAGSGQVLTGMGGVGKTQLAADYARTAWDANEVDVLVWITASNRTAAASGYAQAATEILAVEPGNLERTAAAFLAWLEPKPQKRLCRWLVILDDVADPADLDGLWPPPSQHGRMVATTRRRDAALSGHGRRLVEIGLFTPDEAVSYLTDALAVHGRTEPVDQVVALANDLAFLPLALSQAAAYVVDAGISCAAYRALLADRARTLADTVPDRLPDGQTHTMAAAWALSVDRADQLRPAGLARPMLQLAGFLDPNGIPGPVLTSLPVLTYLSTYRTTTDVGQNQAAVTAEEAVGALRTLHRLNLVDHTPDTPHQAVRVHQLVQRSTRDTLSPEQHDCLARIAADALVATWPEVEYDAGLAQALRANTSVLTACAENALHQPNIHDVLHRTGISLGASGQVTAARDHFQHLSDITAQHVGQDHSGTFVVRHNLATWRGKAGDPVGAATAYAELLHDRVRVQGKDHPDTLSTRHNLAFWRGQAGDASGAVAAFGDLLERMVRELGEDHPDTLATRGNLAHWQGKAGDPRGAFTAFAKLLKDRIRLQGQDHPDTLSARHNAAYWRGQAGNARGALAAFVKLLKDRTRLQGQDHPDTLFVRGELARCRGQVGDPAGAVAAYTELLDDQVRVLGEDHLDTLATRGNLAIWQGEAGNATGAADALARLLEHMVGVLGKDHPDTLSARHELAIWRAEAGDAAEAAAVSAELLEDRLRVLGEDHPDTLATWHNLAVWRGKAGDTAGAVEGTAELLERVVRVLGENHPDTLTARRHLAYWQGQERERASGRGAS